MVLDDVGLLPRLWAEQGDLAAGYAVIVTYHRAALIADGADPSEEEFAVAAECLTGAFLATLVGNDSAAVPVGVQASAADIDEAVAGVVAYPTARPGFAGSTPLPTLRRVTELAAGLRGGPAVCGRR